MRNCKIIATYFGVRRYYPTYVDETIEMLKDLVDNEKSLDPGVNNLDVIFVNHDCGVTKGNEFLDSLNGKKVYCGTIKVIHRPYNGGEGVSLGSLDYGFKELRGQYDYWFLQEDDYKILQPKYYSKGLEVLEKDKEIAFVGYDMYTVVKGMCGELGLKHLRIIKWTFILPMILVGYWRYLKPYLKSINKTKEVIKKDKIPFCGGMMGLTRTKFLSEVVDKFGKLPYPPVLCPPYDVTTNKNSLFRRTKYQMWWTLFAILGEIEFTRIYIDLGYKIIQYPHPENLVYSYKKKIIKS